MNRYLKVIFVFFLLATFLFEGLGINNGREVAYNLILLMPFFLFVPLLASKEGKKIQFPLKFSIIYLLFLVFSFISSIFSVNLQNSFRDLFLYISLFLVFIFVYNFRLLIENIITYLIFALSFIFSIFSQFVPFFIQQKSLFTIPLDINSNFYQFVYSDWSHNHLGDFLLLPLTILIYYLLTAKNKLVNFLFFLFFVPYFIFAYSRSAYLDLALIILFIFCVLLREGSLSLKRSFIFYVLSFIFVIALVILIFAVPTNNQKPALLNNINTSLQEKFDLSAGKQLFAYRNFYATEGLLSFAEKPLFGVGPGNFGYASEKYAQSPTEFSDTAHNIFLEIFVEDGLVAGIFFILLFLQIFHSAKDSLSNKQKTVNNSVVFIFLFAVMLLNFQTDFTYLIHSFFLLFFVLTGLIYDEPMAVERFNSLTVVIASAFLFLVFNMMMLSNISLAKKNYILAFYLYPLNESTYVPLINSELAANNKQKAFGYLNYYAKFFNGDPDALTYAGDVYYSYVGSKLALPYYEKAFDANKFADPVLVKKIYQIKLNLEGDKSAKKFADTYFQALSNIKDTTGQYQQSYYFYRLSALKVCKEIYSGNCPYTL